jgi:hypothetical protein
VVFPTELEKGLSLVIFGNNYHSNSKFESKKAGASFLFWKNCMI